MNKAQQTYAAQVIKMQEMIAMLQSQVDDHFGANPDDVNWGDVGSLERKLQMMNEIVGGAE
jgi:hypothetical protein